MAGFRRSLARRSLLHPHLLTTLLSLSVLLFPDGRADEPDAGTVANGAAEGGVPRNLRIYEAKTSLQDFGRVENEVFFIPVPRILLFDTEGQEIFAITGYDATSFPAQIETAMKEGKRKDGDLAQELAAVYVGEGVPFGPDDLAAAEFTFVEYWADWCAPCKKQLQDVQDLARQHPDTQLNLIKVELDGRDVEIQRE